MYPYKKTYHVFHEKRANLWSSADSELLPCVRYIVCDDRKIPGKKHKTYSNTHHVSQVLKTRRPSITMCDRYLFDLVFLLFLNCV